MILHNKFFMFLLVCLVTNTCFGDSWCDGSQPVGTVVCNKNYYVASCGDLDASLEGIKEALQNNHENDDADIHLSDVCWPLDSTMTTEKHYTNMRNFFNLNVGGCPIESDDTDGALYKIADYKFPDQCSLNDKKILRKWLTAVYYTCAVSARNGAVACEKCPDNGKTNTSSNLYIKHFADNGNPVNIPYWKTFNTIADCYITEGEDERGSFNLGNSSTDKCYYSKE